MTTPNLGLDLVAGADTIATALVTKFNGNMADLDAAVAGKVGAGTPVNNLTVLTSSAGSTPLVVKGILGQSAPLLDLRDNADVTKFAVDATGAITVGGDTTKVSKAGGDTITASGAAVVSLTVKGASGQTGNLLEARNNAGTLLARINNLGTMAADHGLFATGTVNDTVGGNVIGAVCGAATSKGLVVQGAASQSANLAEFQNSAGTVLARVNSNGSLLVGDAAATPSFQAFAGSDITNTSSSAFITNNAAGIRGLVVRGAASQTANLAEFQSANADLEARVTSDGSMMAGRGTPQGRMTVSTLDFPAVKGLVVRGAASQTANLFEAQNSAGTVFTRIDANGKFGWGDSSITATTAVAGGGASLPATVAGFLLVTDHNGLTRKIPYYA